MCYWPDAHEKGDGPELAQQHRRQAGVDRGGQARSSQSNSMIWGVKSGCHLTGEFLATVKPPALAGYGRRGPGVRAEPEPLIRLWELTGIRPGRLGPEARPGALPGAAAEGLAGLVAWIGRAAAAKCSRKEAPRPQLSKPQPCSSRSSRGPGRPMKGTHLTAALSPPAGLLNWNLVAREQFQRREAVDDVMLASRLNQCVVTIATGTAARMPLPRIPPLRGVPFKGRGLLRGGNETFRPIWARCPAISALALKRVRTLLALKSSRPHPQGCAAPGLPSGQNSRLNLLPAAPLNDHGI